MTPMRPGTGKTGPSPRFPGNVPGGVRPDLPGSLRPGMAPGGMPGGPPPGAIMKPAMGPGLGSIMPGGDSMVPGGMMPKPPMQAGIPAPNPAMQNQLAMSAALRRPQGPQY